MTCGHNRVVEPIANVDSSLVRADKAHAWDRLSEPDMQPDTKRRLAAVMPGVQSGLQTA